MPFRNSYMEYQNFKFIVPTVFVFMVGICNAGVEENELTRPGEYCECTFYDKPNTNQKLLVGWSGNSEEQTPVVRIEGNEYVNYRKIYENFTIAIGSPVRFQLLSNSGKIEGSLEIINNCLDDYSGTCENVGMAGQVQVFMEGIEKTYKVEGDCGC